MIVISGLIAVLFLLVVVSPAHAYIDLGTGSYLLQVSLASILTAGVGIKIFWRKIKTFVTRGGKTGRDKNTAENNDV